MVSGGMWEAEGGLGVVIAIQGRVHGRAGRRESWGGRRVQHMPLSDISDPDTLRHTP